MFLNWAQWNFNLQNNFIFWKRKQNFLTLTYILQEKIKFNDFDELLESNFHPKII